MKKTLIWLVAIIVVVSMAMFVGIGCKTTAAAEETTAAAEETSAAEETTAAGEKVTINFWHANSETVEGPPTARIIEAFNEEYPEIEVVMSYDATLDKVLATVTAGNPPDIFTWWGPQFVGSWAFTGALEPLDDIISKEKIDLEDTLPVLNSTTLNGKVYGMPFGTDISMLYYNVDSFIAAGLDPNDPPETIAELLEYAEKLTVVEGGEIKQLGWLPNYGWTHVGGDGSIPVRFGAPFFKEDGSAAFDDPRWIDVFNFAKWPFEKYGFENVQLFIASFGEYGTAQDPLATGQLAMIYDGEWRAAQMANNCPDLNYNIVTFPYSEIYPENATEHQMGGTTIVIPSTAPQKEAAGKLLAFMLRPENIAEFCYDPGLGNVPSSYGALALYDQYKDQQPEMYKYFIDLSQSVDPISIPASPISDEMFTELGRVEELIYSGKVDVETGLADLQETLTGIYQEKVK